MSDEQAGPGVSGSERLEQERAFGRRDGASSRLARQRVEQLLDPDSFFEIGLLARDMNHGRGDKTPTDSVITGYGTVGGHRVGVISGDRVVLGGSSGRAGEAKKMRIFTEAQRGGFPVVDFGEGGGGRIPDIMNSAFGRVGSIAHTHFLSLLAQRDRSFTFIACSMAEMYGDPSFELGLSDFQLMLRSACFGVSGPPIIKAALGETVTGDELGGPDVQERIGQVTRVEETEQDLIATAKRILIYTLEPQCQSSDPAGRSTAELQSIIPESPNRAYDVRKVVKLLFDRDCEPLEMWPNWGRSLVCGFARLGGRAVAYLGNQSLVRAGVMDADSARKGTRLINQAQRLRMPIVFLADLPGFIVGKDAEHQGLLFSAMDYLRAMASANVPKISLILRKAYGFGYFAMGGPGFGSDYTAALPGARIAFMGPGPGIHLIYDRKLQQIADPAERERARLELDREWTERAEPWEAAHAAALDELIQPAEARRTLIGAVQALARRY